jgi:preprotein translocase subunit SecY
MVNWDAITAYFPEIRKPEVARLSFNTKLIWTGIILLLYFILSYVPLYGLGQNALQQFEYLAIILGASFGSVISLGIGPIVTASIVMQLMAGSGMLGLDTSTAEGRQKFQAIQKIAIIVFILFESIVYVIMGGLAPDPALAGTAVFAGLQLALILQLALGAYMIVLMDEITSKWGFGSGVGLFIAAGVALQIFVRAFNPLPSPQNPDVPVGAIPYLFQALGQGEPTGATIAIVGIVATVAVFLVSVYAQAMKVEIPLSFGRLRGYGMRWPLRFFYTGNIPVILIAALLANVQLWARLLQNAGHPFLGTYSGNVPATGLVKWVNSPDVVTSIVTGAVNSDVIMQIVVYSTLMIVGSVIFSILWVQTANMSAESQAKQILSSGLQIPGFRKDPRVLESVLNRYIPGLTVMGGAAVGALAVVADLGGALSRGTGILLTVMIVHKMYEDIAKQHAMDIHPALRKVIESD